MAQEAVLFVVDANFRDLIFERDNLNIINANRSNGDGLSLTGVIVADISSVNCSCKRLACSFVKQEGNIVAPLVGRIC